MSSTRKSKKGFQKLENHELSEFTSLGNGALDSGSENDLLDLTRVEEGESRGRCNSCCCLASCLYFGVLTILFLLLGVYCGYLTFNIWQMTDSTEATHDDIDSRLAKMEAGLKSYKTEMGHKYSTLEQNIQALTNSLNRTQGALKSLEESTGDSLAELRSRVDDLDERLKVAESKPQEMLIKEVDIIHKDMALLNRSMEKLNTSLSDINLVKSQLAEIGSVNSRYDNDLLEIKRGIAEVRQENSDMKESVDAAVEAVASFKSRLDGVDSTLSSTHDQMQQTTDILSAQVTSVQQSLTTLNETLKPCVADMWSAITTMNSSVEMLSNGLATLNEQVMLILNHSPESSMETLDHTPTAPPPTPLPTSKEDLPQSEEGTTPQEPTGEPTTSNTQATESQPTSATEDSIPSKGNENIEVTASVNNEELHPNITEQEIEAGILQLEKEINQTQAAIDLLQSLSDDFLNLDINDDNALDLEEFLVKIPKPFIFSLLDTNQDESLTYEEVLWSISNLSIKMNQLKRQLKSLQSLQDGLVEEEEATTEAPTDEDDNYDPELQKKLKELLEYMLHGTSS